MAPFSDGVQLTTGLVTLLFETLQPLHDPKVEQV
jgi:hypothetical protein